MFRYTILSEQCQGYRNNMLQINGIMHLFWIGTMNPCRNNTTPISGTIKKTPGKIRVPLCIIITALPCGYASTSISLCSHKNYGSLLTVLRIKIAEITGLTGASHLHQGIFDGFHLHSVIDMTPVLIILFWSGGGSRFSTYLEQPFWHRSGISHDGSAVQ